MGVRKKSALRSQLIDIRSLCIWMSAEAANPIVLIIDRDKKDVGLLSGEGGERYEKGQKSNAHALL
jgi:hypothetical protein